MASAVLKQIVYSFEIPIHETETDILGHVKIHTHKDIGKDVENYANVFFWLINNTRVYEVSLKENISAEIIFKSNDFEASSYSFIKITIPSDLKLNISVATK